MTSETRNGYRIETGHEIVRNSPTGDLFLVFDEFGFYRGSARGNAAAEAKARADARLPRPDPFTGRRPEVV